MATHREKYLRKKNLNTSKSYSKKELSKISGISYNDLSKIYDRGRGAWKTNIRSVRMRGSFKKNVPAPRSKKLSAEQWGFARIFAFLNKTFKPSEKLNHDTDIARKYGLA
jgi:hypothetical protein